MNYTPGFLGHHVIIDFYGCDPQTMIDPKVVKNVFHKAAIAAGCTIVNECYHAFEPEGVAGVSGMTIIAESHFSCHCWPEHNYVAIDLFWCCEDVKIQKGIDILKAHFKPLKVVNKDFPRGDRKLAADPLNYSPVPRIVLPQSRGGTTMIKGGGGSGHVDERGLIQRFKDWRKGIKSKS